MNKIDEIISKIETVNPVHAKKLKMNMGKQTQEYIDKTNSFLNDYEVFVKDLNKDLDFGIDCYLRMLSDFTQEYMSFLRTGEYTTKSFEDANDRVYNNPEVMEYYMHGLLISQVLWVHHNDIFLFFQNNLPLYKNQVKSYLEIGAGHGMYISEAINIFDDNTRFDVVDVSPTSIELSKRFIKNNKVNYILSDIFDFEANNGKYDFITLGEVLEHVEKPVELLKKISSLLKPNGVLFLTTPANAPAIDHIYLFRNADEIRQIISQGGFKIKKEITKFVEDVSPEMAEKLKITLMYGALLKQ